MRIYTDNGEYDLPAGFALEIEKKNPFFNKVGEKSLPVTLPFTSNNKRIIGFNAVNRTSKPIYKLDAIIEDGVNTIRAKQIIHGVSKQGISTTFYLGLGRFWEKINNLKVRELLRNKIFRSSNIFKDIIRSMDWSSSYDFVAFPVAVKLSSSSNYFVLNSLEEIEGELHLVGEKERTITEGDISTKCPRGYGITVFLKVEKALTVVVGELGYTLSAELLSVEPFANQLVFLNNVADSVTVSEIRYLQLLPDITVQEFLDIFRKRFNCEFYVDEQKKEVKLIHFDNSFSPEKINDLSNYIDGEPTLNYKEEFSRIILKIKRTADESKTETETIEEFLKKYESITKVNEGKWNITNEIAHLPCVVRTAEARMYAIRQYPNSFAYERIPVGSLNFDYDSGGDLKGEEITLADEAVGIVFSGELMPYAGEAIHLNTAIKDKENLSKTSFPIQLCFAKKYTKWDNIRSYGSVSEYDRDGYKDLDYSLFLWGETGFFYHFYRKRDAMLRHSNYMFMTKLLLPEFLKNTLKEWDKVAINNQMFVPDKLVYTLGINKPQENQFRTIRLYEPYDLEIEQKPIVLADLTVIYTYYWIRNTNMDSLIPPSSGYTDYSITYTVEIEYPKDNPTEEQFMAGGNYLLQTIPGKLITYYMGNKEREEDIDFDVWFTIGKR